MWKMKKKPEFEIGDFIWWLQEPSGIPQEFEQPQKVIDIADSIYAIISGDLWICPEWIYKVEKR